MPPNPVHGVTPRGIGRVPPGPRVPFGKFGRLFPHLAALDVPESVRAELASTMTESVHPSDDNPDIPAAYTYLAQFLDHDLTFDGTSVSEARVDPEAVWNYRTAALDLDSVYGAGPVVQPWLYDRDDPDLLQTGCLLLLDDHISEIVDGTQADLPRSFSGFALIADPRNDQNVIVAQLHLAFLHFHNAVVKWLRDNPDQRSSDGSDNLFDEARTVVVHHYQWIILHDLLPKLVAESERSRVRQEGSRLTATGQAFLPVEFSAAAFRFGHSMVRPAYNISRFVQAATLDQLFRNTGSRRRQKSEHPRVPIDLAWIVDWLGLLGMRPGLTDVQSRRIDPYLTDALTQLDFPSGRKSLPEMNLERGNSLGLPSGQSLADTLGLPLLTPQQLSEGPDGQVVRDNGLARRTPAWYYILKEASADPRDGRCLGPLGGTIVADVIQGLLELDRSSILNQSTGWTPTLPSKVQGQFTLRDLLDFAGVLSDHSRDWKTAPSLRRSAERRVMPEAYVPSLRRT